MLLGRKRSRDSARKRRKNVCVWQYIKQKKRESKDLSLTDKNTRENKNQLEINTLEAYDEGCWKLVRMLTCGQAFSFTPGLESWTPRTFLQRRDSLPARSHKIATWAISQGAEFETELCRKRFPFLFSWILIYLIHGVYVHKCIYELI